MPKKPQHREEIERLIVAGHRAGVCDRDGNSVTDAHGLPTAKPRVGYVTRRFRWDRKLGKLVQVYPPPSADRIDRVDRNDGTRAARCEARR